jgi:DNA topoisomerase-1
MKNLVIVESPAKAKTINKYLGNDFVVTASYGHVRDLPTSKIGVDTEKNFEPTYVIPTKSRKTISELKKLAQNAKLIYLATDLDREGEAISFHITEALKLKKDKYKRITFSEITKDAILKAVGAPRDLNMNLVDAQQGRRVIDRLVGYNLSPLLWKKIYKGLSAGRVQSVAVRLVVEREREIEAFKPEEFWSVEAIFSREKKEFSGKLVEADGRKIEKLSIKNEKEAQEILKKLEDGKYVIIDLQEKEEKRQPYAPFTTSTLQQDASSRLGFSAKQTMKVAQDLYEAGLITYMRTDSVNISQDAIKSFRNYISENYPKSLPEASRVYKSKSKNAQEAHEAIRPSDIRTTAESISAEPKAKKLYDLIWRRALASQMKEAVLDIIEVKIDNKGYVFSSRGQMIKFKGWIELYPEKISEAALPKLEVKDVVDLEKLDKIQHFTEPPARYSEATLVKALEERGIGRPSTYAPTISTIQDRGYVIKDQGRLKPEKIGMIVNDLLTENFPDIVDYDFTAKIEDELDNVAEGKIKWQEVVKEIYVPFKKDLEEKGASIEKMDMDEKLDEKCPDCSKNLVIKQSKRGRFIGCTGFPDCRYTRSYIDEATQNKIDEGEKAIAGRKCPNCSADLKIASGRFGPFIGCSAYPKCKYIEKISQKSKVKNQKSNL